MNMKSKIEKIGVLEHTMQILELFFIHPDQAVSRNGS